MRRFKKKKEKTQVAQHPGSVSRGKYYFYTEKVTAVGLGANS